MPSSLKKIDHIAIIMDGNGRWAKKNSLKKNSGHRSGINTAIKLCKSVARNKSTNHLTLYTFSTENWNRSVFEIKNLFILIEETYELFKDTANQFNIRINHLGITNKLPRKTINTINSAVESRKNNTGLVLHIAFNYGGRREIVDAINNYKKTNFISNGDDYQILFTASADKSRIIKDTSKKLGVKISRIGKIRSNNQKSILIGEKGQHLLIKSSGYKHQF